MKKFKSFINENKNDDHFENLIIKNKNFLDYGPIQYELLLINNNEKKQIGKAFLSEFGKFHKFKYYDGITEFERVFKKYKLNLNLRDGLEIVHVTIVKDYRKKGYGEFFIKKLLEESTIKNKKFVMLKAKNPETPRGILVNYYKKLGFYHFPIDDDDYMIYFINN